MFNRITHKNVSNAPDYHDYAQQNPYSNENEHPNFRVPPISFKTSINMGKPPNTDRMMRSMASEYMDEPSQLLKNSISNSNLHSRDNPGMALLGRSQEGNCMRSSQSMQHGLGSSMTFASMKMAMKSSASREIMAVDRRIKNQVLDDLIKCSVRGTQMTTSVKVNEMLCSSGDGKRAKYRLVESNDPHNMFYCSKCSIVLIQEGYKVQEISSNRIDSSRRREECHDIVSRLETSERLLKEEIGKLQGERYTSALQRRMHKVEEVYDIIILIIEQMKAKDADTTRRSMEQAHLVRAQELKNLQHYLHNVGESKHYILGTMNHALRELPEQEYRSVIEDRTNCLREVESYKSLQLMVKDQPVERVLETIFSEISDHFKSMGGRGRLSAISSSVIEERSDDFTLSDLKQRPFRNLFAEEDLSFNR